MSDFIVGLTGGVASGKSEVTRRFQALGVEVVDADVAAREVVEPGQPALARIAERFGAGMLLADGRLDRRQLRERVFADAQARRDLEAITHPAIRARVKAQAQAAPGPYAVLAIADDVILNDGDPAHLDTAVAALHARYLAAAQPEALD